MRFKGGKNNDHTCLFHSINIYGVFRNMFELSAAGLAASSGVRLYLVSKDHFLMTIRDDLIKCA